VVNFESLKKEVEDLYKKFEYDPNFRIVLANKILEELGEERLTEGMEKFVHGDIELIKYDNDFEMENFRKYYTNIEGLYFIVGSILYREGKYGKAKELYEKSIRNNEDFWPSYYGIGLIYMANEKYEEAYKWFKKAEEKSSTSNENREDIADLYLSLAIVCFELDKYVEAARYAFLSGKNYFVQRDLWPISVLLEEIFRENPNIDIYSKEFEEEVKKREGKLKEYKKVWW